MAFNRDWLEANPIDHSKFREVPGDIREAKVDVSDRLKDILSGFTSGETAWGIKLGKYLTQGTAAPSAPSGTGAAQDMNLYIRTIGTGPYADMYIRGTSGPEIRMTMFGKLCLDNNRMSNNTWIVGTDTNGAAQNILKVNTANAVEFASHIIAPNTGPTTALQLAPKGYVDNQVPTNVPAAKVYNSGWFAIGLDNAYVKTHNLGTTKVLISAYVADNSDGSGNCVQVAANFNYQNDTGGTSGTVISALTTTAVTLSTAATALYTFRGNTALGALVPTTGYARIVMLALE